jgi:hypothetical protein
MPLKQRVALVDQACEELFRRIEADARRRAALGPLADIRTEALKAFRDAFAKASGGAGPAKPAGAVNPHKEIPPLGEPHAAESNSQ